MNQAEFDEQVAVSFGDAQSMAEVTATPGGWIVAAEPRPDRRSAAARRPRFGHRGDDHPGRVHFAPARAAARFRPRDLRHPVDADSDDGAFHPSAARILRFSDRIADLDAVAVFSQGVRFHKIYHDGEDRCDMAQILVRDIEDAVKERLQRRAARYGRSMEAEIRDILRDVVKEDVEPAGGLGTEIAALFKGIGLQEGEEILELRGYAIKNAFEE
jgi:plasmid stability protein